MFVDSHAHLDGKQFDSDREQVIQRAREAGVAAMLAIGNGDGPPELDAGIQLAEKYPFMYATIGIHPHEARLASDHAYAEMERLALNHEFFHVCQDQSADTVIAVKPR